MVLLENSGLGALYYKAVTKAMSTSSKDDQRKPYQKWSSKGIFEMGKYTAKLGANHKPINKSTVRYFCFSHNAKLKNADKEKHKIRNWLSYQGGRTLLMGSLDEILQRYILATWKRGDLVASVVAIATAKEEIVQNPQLNLSQVDRDSLLWTKSLFHRMGFVKRISTTSKGDIPDGARQEWELLHLHEVVSLVEELSMPSNLLLNLDQTTFKYMPAAFKMLLQVSRTFFCKYRSKTL